MLLSTEIINCNKEPCKAYDDNQPAAFSSPLEMFNQVLTHWWVKLGLPCCVCLTKLGQLDDVSCQWMFNSFDSSIKLLEPLSKVKCALFLQFYSTFSKHLNNGRRCGQTLRRLQYNLNKWRLTALLRNDQLFGHSHIDRFSHASKTA